MPQWHVHFGHNTDTLQHKIQGTPVTDLNIFQAMTITRLRLKRDGTCTETRWVHLNQRRSQFSWLLAAEVCASVVVMLGTPCSEVVWRVLATHSICQFPLPCASVCHHISTGLYQNKMYIEKNSILWGAGPIGVGWGITYHACHIVYLKSSHQQHHLNVLPAKRQVQISFFTVGNSVFLPDMAQRSHLKLRCHVVIT